MIAAGIRIEDVTDGGFDLVVELLAVRNKGGAPELRVLHESGVVLSVVHTIGGPVEGPHDRVTDPAALARSLREQYGVSRVVVADADGLGALAAAEPGLAPRESGQVELFLRLAELFWTSPAVACDPPWLDTRWRDLLRYFAGLPDGLVTLVVSDAVRLFGQLESGWLVRIGPLDSQPPGPVVLAFSLSMAELQELLSAPDIAAALLGRPELAKEPA